MMYGMYDMALRYRCRQALGVEKGRSRGLSRGSGSLRGGQDSRVRGGWHAEYGV